MAEMVSTSNGKKVNLKYEFRQYITVNDFR